MLSRGVTLAARWFYEPQPITNRKMGGGFPHRTGRCRPGGLLLSSPGCWSCRCVARLSVSAMGPYPPRVPRDLDLVPRGDSHSALAP